MPSISDKTIGTDGLHTTSTSIAFWFDAGSDFNSRTANLGQQSGTFDIANVKVEYGDVATEYCEYYGEWGGEHQACQRYAEIITGTSSALIGSGNGTSATTASVIWSFKTEKRTAPVCAYNGAFNLLGAGGGAVPVTALTFSGASKGSTWINLTVASNMSGGQGTMLYAGTSTAYVLATCEL